VCDYRVVETQFCRLSPVDARAVAHKEFKGNYLEIIHDIVLWHIAACTSECAGYDVELHPHRVKLCGIWFRDSKGANLVIKQVSRD